MRPITFLFGLNALLYSVANSKGEISFDYRKNPAKGHTEISISFDPGLHLPVAYIPRVGSYPGYQNVPFIVDFDSDDIVAKLNPMTFSKTARKDVDQEGYYADTFYWETDVSAQIIKYEGQDQRPYNVLGLGPESDIWSEFAWMEVCPQQKRIVLHRYDDGKASDPMSWVCGRGDPALTQSSQCDASDACLYPNQNNLTNQDMANIMIRYYMAESHPANPVDFDFPAGKESLNFDWSDINATSATYKNKVIGLVDGLTHGFFTVYDPKNGRGYVGEEHIPVHTHSWSSAVMPTVLMLLLWHWMADSLKDDECKWTRVPQAFGVCITVVCAAAAQKHYDIPALLFHITPVFRISTTASTTMCDFFFGNIILFACATHFFAYIIGDKPRMGFQHPVLHRRFFYEMMLVTCTMLMLLPGLPHNYMKLFLLFLFTFINVISRCLYFMDTIHAGAPKPLDVVLYIYEWAYTLAYFTFMIIVIWIPTMEYLFLRPENKVLMAIGLLFVMCTFFIKTIYTNRLYTYGNIEWDMSMVKQGLGAQAGDRYNPYEVQQQQSYQKFASYISFITGAGAGFASSLQSKYSIFFGKHAVIGIIMAIIAQKLLVSAATIIQQISCTFMTDAQQPKAQNRWTKSFTELDTTFNYMANILSIFVSSLVTNWILNYLPSHDFDTYPLFYGIAPLFIYLFFFDFIHVITSTRVKVSTA